MVTAANNTSSEPTEPALDKPARRPFTSDEREALASARLLASVRMPYLATGIFAMHPVCAPDYPTMAINGRWQVFINPYFLTRNPVEYIAGILVHELGHVLRNHHLRLAQLPDTNERPRNAKLWNLSLIHI